MNTDVWACLGYFARGHWWRKFLSNDDTETTTVNVHALEGGPCWKSWVEGARHPSEGADTWANVLVDYCLMPLTRRNEAAGSSVCVALNAACSKVSLFRRREDAWLIPLPKMKTFCFGLHSREEWHVPEQQHSCNNERGSKVSNSAPAWPVSQHCSPQVAKTMSQLPLPPQNPARVQSGHVFKLSSANRRDGNFSCRNESWGLCSVSSFQARTWIPALRLWNAG